MSELEGMAEPDTQTGETLAEAIRLVDSTSATSVLAADSAVSSKICLDKARDEAEVATALAADEPTRDKWRTT